MRAAAFGVLTPTTSRYTTIEISAIADGMTTNGLEEAIKAPR